MKFSSTGDQGGTLGGSFVEGHNLRIKSLPGKGIPSSLRCCAPKRVSVDQTNLTGCYNLQILNWCSGTFRPLRELIPFKIQMYGYTDRWKGALGAFSKTAFIRVGWCSITRHLMFSNDMFIQECNVDGYGGAKYIHCKQHASRGKADISAKMNYRGCVEEMTAKRGRWVQ